MLAHLSLYGCSGLLVIVGTCLQDEWLEKTGICRTFQHSPGARLSVAGAPTRKSDCCARKCCLSSRYLRKISTAWQARIGYARQDAGFHATFSLAAALCDAVWPN